MDGRAGWQPIPGCTADRTTTLCAVAIVKRGCWMPSSGEILAGLRTIANEWQAVATAWHVAVAALLGSLFLGWRPSKRQAAILLATPLASVSILAWLGGNPFNGSIFALVTVALLAVGMTLPGAAVSVGPPWAVVVGGVLTAFGWVYPHFLASGSWLAYAYRAPLGLIPCPSLSAVVGIALVLRGLGSRTWTITVALAGMAYGLIGVFRLGVAIDVVLLGGAAALAVSVASARRRVEAGGGGRTGGRTGG